MHEVEYILEGDRVLPLLNVSGRIVLTNLRILFQPFSPIHSDPVEKYAIAKISHAVERLLQLRPVGVEVFFQLGTASLDPEPSVAQLVTALLTPSNQKSALLRPLLLSFKDPDARNTFLKELKRLIPSASQSVEDYRLEMTYKWARGELSTFAYLMIVNSWGDRTGSNLSA